MENKCKEESGDKCKEEWEPSAEPFRKTDLLQETAPENQKRLRGKLKKSSGNQEPDVEKSWGTFHKTFLEANGSAPRTAPEAQRSVGDKYREDGTAPKKRQWKTNIVELFKKNLEGTEKQM